MSICSVCGVYSEQKTKNNEASDQSYNEPWEKLRIKRQFMKQNLCTHTESFRRNTIVYINWDEGMHRTHYAYHITIYVVDRTTYNDIVRYGFAKLYVYCI